MEKDPTKNQSAIPIESSLTTAAPVVKPADTATAPPAPMPVTAPEAKAPAKTLMPKAATGTKKTVTAPSAQGAMATFLKASNRALDRSAYNAEKLADIEGNLKNNYILSDAEKDVDVKHALHVILTGGPDSEKMVPGAVSEVNIDTALMRSNIQSTEKNLSSDEQIKYGRAMQIFDSMTANNFKVMKGPGGVYWLESMENGKKVFASNGILEVAELLDRFSGPTNADGKTEETHVETNPAKLAKLVDDNPNQVLLTKAEDWMLRGLATNAITTAIGIGGKLVTAATGGTGIMAGAAGTGIGVVGGLAALGMTFYSDLINKEVTTGEMWTNLGIGAGLELAETVSIAPVGVLNGLRGASTAGKVFRKAIHLYMMKNVVDTATGTDWLKLLDKKEDYSVDDWRKIATMSQFVLGAAGGAALNRIGSRKVMTKQVKEANVELADFDKGMRPTLATTDAKAVSTRKAAVSKLVAKKKEEVQGKADAKVKDLATRLADNNSTIKYNKKAEITKANEAAKASAPSVGANGQTAMNFNAPPAIDKKAIDAKYRAQAKAVKNKYNEDVVKVNKDTEVTLAKVSERGSAISTWAGARQQKIQGKLNDEKIKIEYIKKNAAAKQDLEDSQAKLEVQHGSVIAGRLRAKADRLSTVPKEKIEAAAKPAEKVKVESKLEVFAKEKIALEKKLKEVEVDKRAPEDIAELKRIEDGIVAENKKIKGLRGAGNKLLARVKAGSSLTKRGASSLASYVNAVPSSLAVRDGVSSKALAKASISSDDVDDMTGNRFYQYSLEDAKARLKEEGFSEEEINKYNLKQLRNALYKIEKGDKGAARDKEEAANPKVIKRPKVLQTGGVIKFSTGGFIKKLQYGDKFDRLTNHVLAKPLAKNAAEEAARKKKALAERAALIERNRLTTEYNVRTIAANKAWKEKELARIQADLVAQLKKNRLDSYDIKDEVSSGRVTNTGDAEAIEKAKKDAADVVAKYDKIISGAAKVEYVKPKFGFKDAASVFSEFRASDFIGKAKMFVERPPREDVKAATFLSNPVENMPGFERAMDRTHADSQRVDTADMFTHRGVMLEKFAEAGRQRAELVARNSQHVMNARAEQVNNMNRNTEAAVNADNANIQAKNAAESVYSAQRAQGLAAVKTANDKQLGQRLNNLVAGVTKVYKAKRTEDLTSKYNTTASVKSIWNNEYKPRYDAAVASGDQIAVKQVKSEFITANKYDPDDLDKQLMDYKTQFRALDA